jgi:hypothetical protein
METPRLDFLIGSLGMIDCQSLIPRIDKELSPSLVFVFSLSLGCTGKL